jgi:Holliday junction resolvasome RuvABC endonuclease subunit
VIVLGYDPGIRVLAGAVVHRNDGAVRLTDFRSFKDVTAPTRKLTSRESGTAARAVAEAAERWMAAMELDAVAIEQWEAQGGKRTSGHAKVWIPWQAGWLERASHPVPVVTVSRNETLSRLGLRGEVSQARARRFVEQLVAAKIPNEHVCSAVMVAVAGAMEFPH